MHSLRVLFLAGVWVLLLAYLVARPALAQTNPTCYPTFSVGCTSGDGLNRFVFNGLELSRNTGCTSNQTYPFPVANIVAGQTYPITGTLLSSTYASGVAIWVDMDRSGTFESGERLFQTPSPVVGSFSGNLTIPATFSTGPFYLRIVVQYGAVPTNPCGSYTYGEVEQYVLNIANGSCAAPTGLVAPTPTVPPTDFLPATTVSWTPVSNVSYEVAWGPYLSFGNVPSNTAVTGTSARLARLAYDKVYTVQVRSRCDPGGTGFYSPYTSLTFNSASSCPVVAPTSLSAVNITNSSAYLFWTSAFSTADIGFEARYRVRNSSDPWTVLSGRSFYSPGSFGFTFGVDATQLASGTQYEWQARNACGIDQGSFTAWSGLAYFTTTGTACPAPTSLNVTFPTANTGSISPTFTATWNGVSGAGSYNLQYGPTSSTALPYSTTGLTSPTYPNGFYAPNTPYALQVQTVCSNGNLSPATSITFLSPTACGVMPPYSLTTTGIGNTSAALNWTSQSRYLGGYSDPEYELQWRAQGSSTWTTVVSSTATSFYLYPPYSLMGLQPGTAYQWQVRSKCRQDGSYSDWVGPLTFTTTGGTCLGPVSVGVSPPTPSSTTGGSTLQALVSWSPVPGVSSYELRWFSSTNPTFVQSVSGLTTSPYTLTGLDYSTTYTVQLRGLCSNGSNSAFVSTIFSTPSVCPSLAPLNLTTTAITSTSAFLDWSFGFAGGYYPSGFELQWRQKNTTTWNTVSNLSLVQSEYRLTGLTDGTTYEWQVRSQCGQSDYSNWVGPVSFTTTGGLCNAPTGLSVSFPAAINTTPLPYGFSWNPTAGVSTYELLLTAIESSISPVSATGLSTAAYSSTLLYPETRYLLQVRSRCTNGSVSAYASITFTTPASCPAPYLPETRSITSSSAALNWFFSNTNPALFGNTFLVFWRVRGSTTWNQRGGIMSYPYTLTGLSASTAYEWQVAAQCPSSNQSAFSEILSFATLSIPCNAPASVTASAPALRGIYDTFTALVGWSTVAGAVSYDIYQEEPVGMSSTLITQGFSQTSLIIAGRGGVTYIIRVRANCAGGQSAFTSLTLVMPVSCTLFAPIGLTTTAVTSNSAQVSFGINSNANYYIDTFELQWRVAGTAAWNNSLTIASSNFGPTGPSTLTGLQPGTAYEWQVRSRCRTGGASPFAGPAGFTTPAVSSTGPSALEYFFDTDPGYGNATPVAGFSLTNNATPFTFQAPMPGNLPDGLHFMHLRAKDASGNWSVVGIRAFFKDTYPTVPPASTSRMEYFVDNDPGFGLATAISGYASGSAQTNFTFTVPMPNNLSDGIHFLHLRTQDASGKWSVVGIRSFFKDTYPAQPLPAITRIEYFVDTDPGFGNGSALTGFSSGTLVDNFSIPIQLTGLTSTTHTIYIRAQDANGQWSLLGARSFTFDGTVVICASMYTVKDGSWTDPTVWSCGRIPTATDAVQVKHRITVPGGSTGLAKQIGLDAGARVIYGTGSRIRLGF